VAWVFTYGHALLTWKRRIWATRGRGQRWILSKRRCARGHAAVDVPFHRKSCSWTTPSRSCSCTTFRHPGTLCLPFLIRKKRQPIINHFSANFIIIPSSVGGPICRWQTSLGGKLLYNLKALDIFLALIEDPRGKVTTSGIRRSDSREGSYYGFPAGSLVKAVTFS
jgi:hypothetical protein